MNEQLPIGTTPTEEDQNLALPIDVSSQSRTPADFAERRAWKASVGLGWLDQSYDQLIQDLSQGREDQVRLQAATEIDRRKGIFVQQAIAEAAKNKQAPLTMDELDFIKERAEVSESTDPSTVFEVFHGKAYMSYLDTAYPGYDNIWKQAQQEDPEYVRAVRKGSEEMIAKRELSVTSAENALDAWQNQSYLGTAVDIAKMIIPGYYESMNRGWLESISALGEPLLGSNMELQIKALYRLPLPEFKVKLDEIINTLKQENPMLAVQFSMAIVRHSTSDEALNNLGTFLEIPFIGQVAKAGKALINRASIAKLRREVQGIARDMVKSTEGHENGVHVAQAATGDIANAAVTKAVDNLKHEFKGQPEAVKALESLPSALRSDTAEAAKNPGRFGQTIVDLIQSRYNTFTTNLMDMVSTISRVERIPVIRATQKAVDTIKNNLGELFPGLRNYILDLDNVRYNNISNTYSLDINLGKPGGEMFMNYQAAQTFAKNKGLSGFKINRQGNGYYITVNRNLDETHDIIRDLLLETNTAKEPVGWLRSWTGWIRTPEETLSEEQRMNRKVATYAASELVRFAKEEAEYIRNLKRSFTTRNMETGVLESKLSNPLKNHKKWKEWERVVTQARDQMGPDNEPGYFFRSPGELEDAYLRWIKRMPEQDEIEAYFAYKRLVEMDRMLRNIAVYRNKARLGVETHTFSVLDDAGKKISNTIDGVMHHNIPGGEYTVLVVGKTPQESKLLDTKRFSTKEFKRLREDVATGRKQVMEIYDPEQRPLQGFGKVGSARVRYVIADAFETKPLSWEQVPRRGGGHWEFDYDFYIKQAKMRPERIGKSVRHWYEGDTTLMPIMNRKMGQDVANHVDTVRELLRKHKEVDAKAYVDKHLPDIGWQEVSSWFKATKVGDETRPAKLSLTEPLRVVPSGGTIVGLDKTLEARYGHTFKDGTKSGSLARQHQVEFTGERDAYEVYTVQDKGSLNNPIYKYLEAEKIDPITSLDRSLSRIINSHFMDDYKIMSAEHWLRQATKYLKATDSELRATPFYHFRNPVFKENADAEAVNRLKIAHWQIDQFMGQRDVVSTFLDSTAQKLADSIYGMFGPKALKIAPIHMLPKMQDATQFVRSVTFNAKLGLWAIPQLIVQSQTYGVIYGIAGSKMAVPGSVGALLTQYTRLNRTPAVMNKLDEIATKVTGMIPGVSKYKPGEFIEAVEAMDRVGFGNVAGEYAMLDTAMAPRVIASGTKSFLDAGQIFFREGERNVRYGAWFTAFKEFRDANPTGRLTNRDLRQILDRADLLTVNMSRASSSALHTGLLSIPTQFLTYQLRLAELMFGKRLTTMERARLFAWQAGLYGVPTALGVTGFPIGDVMRKHMIENGYVVGENRTEQAVTEGLPALMLSLATGNDYNVGDRFGSQGFEILREALRGDEAWWTILGGPALSVFSNTLANGDAFYRSMISGLADDGKSFPITVDDALDVFNEVKSLSDARRLIAAVHTGRWMSKRENYLSDTSPANAIFMTLTGLQPQGTADLNTMTWSRKDQLEHEKDYTNKFIKEFRRGLQANKDENYEQAKKYFTRAFTYLHTSGINPDKHSSILSRAIKGNESLIDSMRYNYYIKDAPVDQREARRNAFIQLERMKDQ